MYREKCHYQVPSQHFPVMNLYQKQHELHYLIASRDFMKDRTKADPENYFSVVSSSQQGPEFTMRNLNCLLAHESPIPHNLYEFIRAREIFDRIESYKTFLDDLRS